MERDFTAMLAGELSPAFTADDGCFDTGMYSGMSFTSLLNSNPEKFFFPSIDKTLYTSLEYPYGTSSPAISYPESLIFSGEYSPLKNAGDQKPKPIDFVDDYTLKISENISTEPFNFIQNFSDSSIRTHHRYEDFALAESSNKRVKSLSPSKQNNHPYDVLNSIIRNFQISSTQFGPYQPKPTRSPANELARERRKKINDKTRRLEKMLPWDRKMDTATMLEETYKYVQFLEAQVKVLRSMPCVGSSLSGLEMGRYEKASVFGGVLGKLNRQQLLEVMVNSPVVQKMMYSQGWCVYSVEQLFLLKKIADMDAMYQQQMKVFDPSFIS